MAVDEAARPVVKRRKLEGGRTEATRPPDGADDEERARKIPFTRLWLTVEPGPRRPTANGFEERTGTMRIQSLPGARTPPASGCSVDSEPHLSATGRSIPPPPGARGAARRSSR